MTYPSSTRPRARRPLMIVAATLLTLGGLIVAASIGLIVVFGRNGDLTFRTHHLTSTAAAVAVDVGDIQNTSGVAALTGWPTVSATVQRAGRPQVFVGIGPADKVESFLSGIAVDRVRGLTADSDRLVTDRQPGQLAAGAPAAQSFWLATSTSGASDALHWKVTDGRYQLVVMNADGSGGIDAALEVRIELPRSFDLSLAALGGGALLVITGAALMVRALRPA